jgi:hypothetical protein
MSGIELITLKDWNEKDRLPVVDIRESQVDGRLMHHDTVVVHLPLSTLLSGERSCELPPRNVPFAILTQEIDLDSAQAFFSATTSKTTQQSRKPWLVTKVLVTNDSFWTEARERGLFHLETQTASPNGNDIFRPLPRLWKPDPMVMNVLWPLLKKQTLSLPTSVTHSEEVWDLGSGAGRDVCFLAEQSKAAKMNRFKFVGIDNHKGSMKRCLPFWKYRQVEEYTEARNMNLNKVNIVREELNGRTVVCLYAVRFWNAKLVKFIANDTKQLQAGTLFAMSHFCKPYPGAPWNFDHPKVHRDIP